MVAVQWCTTCPRRSSFLSLYSPCSHTTRWWICLCCAHRGDTTFPFLLKSLSIVCSALVASVHTSMESVSERASSFRSGHASAVVNDVVNDTLYLDRRVSGGRSQASWSLCARSLTTGPMTVSTPSCVGVPSLSSNLKSERTTVNVPSYALQRLQNMRHHRICQVNDPRLGRECLRMVSD